MIERSFTSVFGAVFKTFFRISPSQSGDKNWTQRRGGPGVIAVFLVLAALVGFFGSNFPAVRDFTMPRFGWIGLVLCLNPLIFLLPYLWTPKRSSLMSSAGMTIMLGVVNAALLIHQGTVSVVANKFTDRLHSSWLWSVLIFFVVGAYLYRYAIKIPSRGDE